MSTYEYQNGGEEDGEWDDEEEWEWEEEEEEEEEPDEPVDAKGAPDIKIQGSVLKIDRKDVVWSDDEYEESEEEEEEQEEEEQQPKTNGLLGSNSNNNHTTTNGDHSASPVPPPPPPPPAATNGKAIPAPPPLPPGAKQATKPKGAPNQKVEQLKKRADKRPNWKDLMSEIESYRNSHGKLRKVQCNDRSKPMLTTTKLGKSFVYDSEKNQANKDIMDEIKKGKRLRHVKTNDRSRPNLRGIRSFRRQCTKEERLQNGFAFTEEEEAEEGEAVEELRDDLESTKQLLELEIRSKKLLERDNKKLQAEVERMRAELVKMQRGEEVNAEVLDPAAAKARRDSMASKRQSMIRLLSESESSANVHSMLGEAAEAMNEDDEEDDEEATDEEPVRRRTREEAEAPRPPREPLPEIVPYERKTIPAFEQEVIENMKEEVDEARKLAEEWEHRYKEMQRQMTDLDHGKGKRMSIVDAGAGAGAGSIPPSLQRMVSSSSGTHDVAGGGAHDDDEEGEGWMLRRELHMLVNKFRTIADKREVVQRERQLLNERMDNIIESIAKEVDARKKLRKEVNEMNEAFKDEIAEMAREELTAKELEECYFDDDELVENKFTRQTSKLDDDEEEDDEASEEDVEETLDDILKLAEDEEGDDEEDPGHHLFEEYPETDEEEDAARGAGDDDIEKQIDLVNGKIDRHSEYLQLMRKSNFMMKSKIDRLFDILQMQREQHHDLKQELTRMLADIQ